jgi:hypothetical protein
MLRSYVMFVAFRWVNMSLVQLLSYQRFFVVQNFTIITIYIAYIYIYQGYQTGAVVGPLSQKTQWDPLFF